MKKRKNWLTWIQHYLFIVGVRNLFAKVLSYLGFVPACGAFRLAGVGVRCSGNKNFKVMVRDLWSFSLTMLGIPYINLISRNCPSLKMPETSTQNICPAHACLKCRNDPTQRHNMLSSHHPQIPNHFQDLDTCLSSYLNHCAAVTPGLGFCP